MTNQTVAIIVTLATLAVMINRSFYLKISCWAFPSSVLSLREMMEEIIDAKTFRKFQIWTVLMSPLTYLVTLYLWKTTLVCLALSLISMLVSRYILRKTLL